MSKLDGVALEENRESLTLEHSPKAGVRNLALAVLHVWVWSSFDGERIEGKIVERS